MGGKRGGLVHDEYSVQLTARITEEIKLLYYWT